MPPPLPGEEELIGEAEESEPSMAGLEVAEEDIRTRHIADQISELIKARVASGCFNAPRQRAARLTILLSFESSSLSNARTA